MLSTALPAFSDCVDDLADLLVAQPGMHRQRNLPGIEEGLPFEVRPYSPKNLIAVDTLMDDAARYAARLQRARKVLPPFDQQSENPIRTLPVGSRFKKRDTRNLSQGLAVCAGNMTVPREIGTNVGEIAKADRGTQVVKV